MEIKTVFDALINENFDEFMNFLNQPDFDPNIKDSEGDPLLLVCILIPNIKNIEKYIKEVLKKKPDLNLQGKNDWTALMAAARFSINDTESIVKMLIDSGADPNIQNINNWTALMEVIRYVNHTNENKESGKIVIQALIEIGANLDLQDKEGWTALMMAVKYSTLDIVKLLINAGADPNIKNKMNKTAIHFTNDSMEDLPLQLLLLKAGTKEIPYKKYILIRFKIQELQASIAKYKRLLNEKELELLKESRWYRRYVEESIVGIEILEKYLKNIKTMIKLRPGSDKVKEIETQFNKKSVAQAMEIDKMECL